MEHGGGAQGLPPVAMTSEDTILVLVKLLFALLAVGAIGAFVVWPIWRMLRRTEDAELIMKPFEPPTEEELQIPVDPFGEGKKFDRNQVIDELRADPRKTAQVLQAWLREKDRRGGGKPSPKGQ